MGFVRMIAVVSALVLAPVAGWTQQLIGSYEAVIGQQDRFNSSGVALSGLANILVQDRANVHRFAIGQAGDYVDTYFITKEKRSEIPELVRRGQISPAASAKIAFGTAEPIVVEIFGQNGRASFVRVSLKSERGQSGGTMSRVDAVFAQQMLAIAGLYRGPVDGNFGPESQRALDAFRSRIGRPTGQPLGAGDLALLKTPGGVASGAQTVPDPAGAAPTPPTPPPGAVAFSAGAPGAGAAPVVAPVVEEVADVARHLGLWVIGARPALVENLGVQSALRKADLPPEFPKITGNLADRDALMRDMRAIADVASAYRPPSRIVVDVPVNIAAPADNAPYAMRFGYVASAHPNRDLDASTPEALRTLAIAMPYNVGPVVLKETRPLPLSLPDKIKNAPHPERAQLSGLALFENESTFIRFAIELSEGEVILPLDPAQGVYRSRVSAEVSMRVVEASLYRQKRTTRREPDQPEVLLHRWTRDNALPAAPADVSDPAAIAERYSLILRDGRLLFSPQPRMRDFGVPPDRALHQKARGADLAIRAAALIGAAPERALSDELALALAMEAMQPLERSRMLPVGFDRTARESQMSELEWQLALRAAKPAIKQQIGALAPPLPFELRSVVAARLTDYDAAIPGFPLRFDRNALSWLPTGRQTTGFRQGLDNAPDVLGMEEAEAVALLDRLRLSSRDGRQVWLSLDYEIGAVPVPVVREGEIRLAEAERLTVPHRPVRMILSEDPFAARPLMEHVFDTGPAASARAAQLPAELYQTTADALWGAYSRLPGGEKILQDIANNLAGVQRAPASQRSRLGQEAAERMRALARPSYLVGAVLRLGPYDPERGGFALERGASFVPVAHDQDISGLEPPTIGKADPKAFRFLPATPEQAAEIPGYFRNGSLYALARVEPVSVKRSVLVVSTPGELLIGPPGRLRGSIEHVAMRIALAPPPALSAHEDMTVARPAEIYLDAEAVDLFALARRPDLFDEAAFRRMLLERLAKERYQAAQDRPAPWGAFFAHSDLDIDAAPISALLPAFTAWTKARAAVLPETVLVAYQFRPGRHPVTGCTGFAELAPSARPVAVSEAYGALVGADAAALAEDFGNWTIGSTPLPGPDRALALSGRPSHQARDRQAVGCAWLNPKGRDDIAAAIGAAGTDAAPYVDAVAILREMPTVGRHGATGWGASYRARVREVSLHDPAPGTGDGAGFRGVAVFDLEVTGVDVMALKGRSGDIGPLAQLTPEDWQTAAAVPPGATDILGLALRSDVAEFLTLARERLADAVEYRSVPAGEPGLFGRAVARVRPDGSEIMLAATAWNGQVIGLMRHVSYSRDQATKATVLAALAQKYGVPHRVNANETEVYWGVPEIDLDRGGVCGGHFHWSHTDPPGLEPTAPVEGTAPMQPYAWRGYGWPSGTSALPTSQSSAPEDCGPVVSARLSESGGGVNLTVWVHDVALAWDLAQSAPQEPTAPADIDL